MRHTLVPDTIANESIAFQTQSAFFKELVLNLQQFKGMAVKDIADSPIVDTLNKVVEHHTGLNVAFNLGNIDPSVNIPNVDRNNILINSFIRNFINSADGVKLINNASGSVRGKVNLNTGMVSGIFSEVKSIINLPTDMLSSTKYTAEEIAAITLHEVGHLFVYYEYMSRTVTTNQMLAGLSKALDKSDTVAERESVLINVKKAMNLTELDEKTLAKSTNNKVVEIVVISNISREVKSELGSNIYDFSTWEYLADQYAARQGAGRHLATGLEKIYKGTWNISFRSLPVYLAMEATKALLVIAPIVLAATTGIILGSVVSIGIILMGMDSDTPTYDRPGERMKRIRDQIVENLKDKRLSKDDVERLEADIVAIDVILKDIEDRRQWIGAIIDTVSSSARKAHNQEVLQKELEDIAVNELFIKAALLSKI